MWENNTYVVESGTLLDNVIKTLNKYGEEGWEVSGILKNKSDEVIFFLKRQVSSKKTLKQSPTAHSKRKKA